MILTAKVKIIAIFGVILVIGILFGLWRTTSIKLANTREQLSEVTCQLDTVTKEHARLVEYNKQRDKQIKELERQYTEKLNAIPADLCGDTKPSKELIEFFKNGEK